MKTQIRLTLLHEVDETLSAILDKAQRVDHFASHDAEHAIAAALMDRWDARVHGALHLIKGSSSLSIDHVMLAFKVGLSRDYFQSQVGRIPLDSHIAEAFNKGRASVSAMYAKQTGREAVRKDMNGNLFFGQLFGLTEDHALQALMDQLTVAAGGLWDEQLSESIKAEIQKFFDGTLTREEIAQKIEDVVNTRLLSDGDSSLPGSYFDNLATHQIVRARNVGSYYRAKSLGAAHYTLINPRDGRTSPICRAVADGKTVFTMAGAEETVSGILTASSVSDLKSVAPFYKAGDTVTNPVPPLHWPKCRTWMNYVFE